MDTNRLIDCLHRYIICENKCGEKIKYTILYIKYKNYFIDHFIYKLYYLVYNYLYC